ncbi:MAG: VanZ family protein [Candidatus Aminicenantes bacterium]|nr:VanZ family protein [Candidatus Aminicenantes bacterium]
MNYFLPPLLLMALIFPMGNRALGSSRLREIFAAVFLWLAPHASEQTISLAYVILRKTSHFMSYGLLAFLFYRAFRGGRGPFWSKRTGFLAASAAIAYGFLDELLQTFVPSRIGSPFDWAIDTAGVLTSIALLAWMCARRDRAAAALSAGKP